MVEAWHREEPREVRPFFQLAKAEDALLASRLRLFADGHSLTDTTYDLDDIDFRKLALRLEPVLSDPKIWMPEGLKLKDLKLVLVARHAFLKRSYLLEEVVVAPEALPSWDINSETLSRFSGGRNLELTLALCLSSDRAWKPGAPHLLGHWIAQKTFSLRTRTVPQLFDLRPTSDEEWLKSGFPAKTFLSVEYNGGIFDTEVDGGDSVATVRIHEDAHNKMTNNPSLGESLQPLLAAEIISTILIDSFDEWRDASTVKGSALETILKQLSKSKTIALADLKALVKEPRKLRAVLQDHFAVVQQL
jgi:hypothetical protein